MSRRPAFFFYPADWRSNANLRRCSWGARGVWVEVMGLMHDSDEYGVLRWTLKEIAQAVGAPLPLIKELAKFNVMKGCDSGECEAYVYTPRSGRKDGEPVILLPAQAGPIWYSSRMLRDEYVRANAGASTRFGTTPPDVPSPRHAPSPSPRRAPSRRQGVAAEAKQAAPIYQDSPLRGNCSIYSGDSDLSHSNSTITESPSPSPRRAPSQRQGDGSSSSSSLSNYTNTNSPKSSELARWCDSVRGVMDEHWPDDSRVETMGLGMCAHWIADGFDLDLDVLPTVRQLCTDKLDGQPPNGPKYFSGAIARRHAERLAAGQAGDQELKARLELWNRFEHWEDAWGPKPTKRPIDKLPEAA